MPPSSSVTTPPKPRSISAFTDRLRNADPSRIALSLLGTVLLLIVAHSIATLVSRHVYALSSQAGEQGLAGPNTPQTIQKTEIATGVMARITYVVVMGGAILMSLHLFGIEATSVIAGIGTIGVVAGFVLQGILSDMASGLVIAIQQPFRIGDVIKADGVEGYVMDYGLLNTRLLEVYSRELIVVSNRRLQVSMLNNLTAREFHYEVVDVLVSNSNKSFTAIADILKESAQRIKGVLPGYIPVAEVLDMNKVGVTMRVLVPMSGRNYSVYDRMAMHTHLRESLAENQVILLDPLPVAAAAQGTPSQIR